MSDKGYYDFGDLAPDAQEAVLKAEGFARRIRADIRELRSLVSDVAVREALSKAIGAVNNAERYVIYDRLRPLWQVRRSKSEEGRK